MYARKFPKFLRRLIEFFVLMLAISSFGLLSYLHVVFNRNPINCLASIQDKWPRDGILRVEIVHNASSFYIMSYDLPPVSPTHNDQTDYTVNYSLKESYEKEYSNSMLDLFSSYINTEEIKYSANNEIPSSTEPDTSSHQSNEPPIVSKDIIEIESLLDLNDSIVPVLSATNTNESSTTLILDSKLSVDDSVDITDITGVDELTESTDEVSVVLNATSDELQPAADTLNTSESTNTTVSPVAYAVKFSVENHKKEIPTSTIEKMSPAYRLIKEAFSELQLISRVCKLNFFYLKALYLISFNIADQMFFLQR